VSDLYQQIQDAMRLVSEHTTYEPNIHIVPSWLKRHDDPEPQIVVCSPEDIAVVRAMVNGYGLADYFEVREDEFGIAEPGRAILMRPGAWRL